MVALPRYACVPSRAPPLPKKSHKTTKNSTAFIAIWTQKNAIKNYNKTKKNIFKKNQTKLSSVFWAQRTHSANSSQGLFSICRIAVGFRGDHPSRSLSLTLNALHAHTIENVQIHTHKHPHTHPLTHLRPPSKLTKHGGAMCNKYTRHTSAFSFFNFQSSGKLVKYIRGDFGLSYICEQL